MIKVIVIALSLLLTTVAANAQCGVASWYGGADGLNGNRTASGEIFNTNDLTAAHRTLPFGTLIKVTGQRTGNEIVVRINDRGPFHKGRIIDLSKAAAIAVGIKSSGVGPVCLEKVE